MADRFNEAPTPVRSEEGVPVFRAGRTLSAALLLLLLQKGKIPLPCYIEAGPATVRIDPSDATSSLFEHGLYLGMEMAAACADDEGS